MIGIVCVIAGWFAPDSASDSGQVQRGGAGSTNLQAGRDIRVDIRANLVDRVFAHVAAAAGGGQRVDQPSGRA
jgi:hypothetical protein